MTETLAMALPARSARPELDFDELYRASRDDLYAYVASVVRDPATAEDVTAAAFERAFRRRGSYRARRGTPRAWIFGIARNAALDELRRRKRVAPLVADPEDVEATAIQEDSAEQSVRRAAIRRALVDLDARDRELVALKFFAGLSNSELATVLGTTESNAGTLLHRAVAKLRKACHDAS